MRAGLLRHKITIQQATETRDDYGEADETWSTFRVVRASMRIVSGDEDMVSDVRSPVRIVEFGLHYIDGITNKMRIKHGDDIYNILVVENINLLNRDLLITAHEAV